ncbi:MAG: DUF6443 domain-containing protein, partial [Bacteroidota bacterium]
MVTKNYLVATSSSAPSNQAQTVQSQVTYVDGLGRPIQQVAYKQSGTGGDLITHMEYDDLGRATKSFLPYERTSATLSMDGSAATNVANFYDDPYYQDTTNPYTESDLEKSPRARVEREAAPGVDWELGSGREVKYSYRFNNTNEVYLFTTTDNGSGA